MKQSEVVTDLDELLNGSPGHHFLFAADPDENDGSQRSVVSWKTL